MTAASVRNQHRSSASATRSSPRFSSHSPAIIKATSPGWPSMLRSGGELLRVVSQLLVDDIQQWLMVLEVLELRDEQIHGLLEPIGRVVGAVRRQQHIVET